MSWVLHWVQHSALGLFRPWKIGHQRWEVEGGGGGGGEELPLKEK